MLFGEIAEIFQSLYQYDEGKFLLESNKDKKIQEIIQSGKDLLFEPKKIDIESIKQIQSTLLELKERGLNIQSRLIGVEYSSSKQSYLTAEDCKNLKAFEMFLKDNFNAELVISSVEDIYNVDDIINVNARQNFGAANSGTKYV